MSIDLDAPPVSQRLALDAVTAAALSGAALAFNLGGALHPNDAGSGNKVAQLHDMLLRDAWWPSHLGLLVSFGLFTAAFLRLGQHRELTATVRRVLRGMGWISALTTAAMVPHLFAPLGAHSIADGESNALSVFMTVNETLANAPWAVGLAVLALVTGTAGVLGNRATAVVGMIGGVSFATAAVTIPFTDALDALFAVGGMGITLWTLAVVAVGLHRRRRTVRSSA